MCAISSSAGGDLSLAAVTDWDVWVMCSIGMVLKSPPFLLSCRTHHSLENQTVTLLKGSVLMPQSGPISPAALLLGNTDLPQSFLVLAF